MEEKVNTEMNDNITTSYESRCFIQLHEDVYVAKEFKNNMYIHIRHYDETEQ